MNGCSIWVYLKYEKLPRIRFQWGWVVHSEKGCDGEMSRLPKSSGIHKQFGSCLRADLIQCKKVEDKSK